MTDVKRVTWLHTPPNTGDDALAIISEALVPMFVWTMVPISRVTEQKLSVIERFFLETALELGDLTAEDLDELTSLPAEATHRIAGRLHAMGTLQVLPDRYVVREEQARAALSREVLVEYHRDHMTFLYLPRTDDVLAFEHRQGRPEPPKIHRLNPIAQAAVPAQVCGQPRHELLRERIIERRIAGLPEDVVDIDRSDNIPDDTNFGDGWDIVDAEIIDVDGDHLIDDTCPVYRASGRVRLQPDRLTAFAYIYGDGDDRREPLDLTDADGIIKHWLVQTDLLARPDVQRKAWLEIVAPNGNRPRTPDDTPQEPFTRTAPLEWECRLADDTAQTVADQGRLLSAPGGLEIVGHDVNGSTTTRLAVRFQPLDQTAAVTFAIEHAAHIVAISTPMGSTPISTAIIQACRTYQLDENALTEDQVRDRLWQRDHCKLIYHLRSTEDFAYA